MDQADRKISLLDYQIKSTHPRLIALEQAIATNALITEAYAGLYQDEFINAPYRAQFYLWLPGAAFASFEVGQVMRHAYKRLAISLKERNLFFPKVYSSNHLNNVFLGDLNFTSEKIAQVLIKGNVAVYKDLFWQHLAFSKCGMSTTIRVLKQGFDSATSFADMLHWSYLKNGWQKLNNGRIEEGNLALTRVEQEIVLQPLIYSGPLAYLGGTLFAKLGKTPIHDANFNFPTFTTYCQSHDLSLNFSNFESRWAWIVDQMKEMGVFFDHYPERLSHLHNFMKTDSLLLLDQVRYIGPIGVAN